MIWVEANLVTKKNSTVVGVCRVAVPFAQPPSTSITRSSVIRVTAKEIDGESTAGAAVGGGRVGEAALEVEMGSRRERRGSSFTSFRTRLGKNARDNCVQSKSDVQLCWFPTLYMDSH